MAFFFAGAVAVVTLVVILLNGLGEANRPTGGQPTGSLRILIIGFGTAGLIASTHWIGW